MASGLKSPIKRMGNLQFPIFFLSSMVVLMSLYYSLPNSFIETIFVRFFAVLPSVFLLDWITPNHEVIADETRIISPIARLNVLKGCEGTEALLILYSAIIATLRPLKATLIGLLLGTLAVFLLNQSRIIALFFIAAYQKAWFEPAHGFLAPIIIIAIAGLFFMFWLRSTQTPTTK